MSFVQVFEIVLNVSYDVVVFDLSSNSSVTLSFDGDELSSFLSSLDADTVVEYPAEQLCFA
jgi:hypothetical protein